MRDYASKEWLREHQARMAEDEYRADWRMIVNVCALACAWVLVLAGAFVVFSLT